jgi:hypothetical protein
VNQVLRNSPGVSATDSARRLLVELLCEPGSASIEQHKDELQDAGEGPNQERAGPWRSNRDLLQVGGGPHEVHAQLGRLLEQALLPCNFDRDEAKKVAGFTVWDDDVKEQKALHKVHCPSCKRHDPVVDQAIALPSLASVVGREELPDGASDIGQKCDSL